MILSLIANSAPNDYRRWRLAALSASLSAQALFLSLAKVPGTSSFTSTAFETQEKKERRYNQIMKYIENQEAGSDIYLLREH